MADLTVAEIQNYILDPAKSISFVLDRMSDDSNNVLSFQDPTNPAVNLLEFAAFSNPALS